MDTVTKNGVTVGVLESSTRVETVQDILDLILSAAYGERAAGVIIYKECLPERFFDLKTGFAGDVLQKFSNYRFKLAVIGDFSLYNSKSLKDFIYECNKGKLVFFKSDIDSAVSALTGI